jgi:hypothetical protein
MATFFDSDNKPVLQLMQFFNINYRLSIEFRSAIKKTQTVPKVSVLVNFSNYVIIIGIWGQLKVVLVG